MVLLLKLPCAVGVFTMGRDAAYDTFRGYYLVQEQTAHTIVLPPDVGEVPESVDECV